MSMTMDEEIKKIGNRIRKMRKTYGMSQKELAAALDISITNMSNIETGKTAVTIQNLIKIKNVFGCELKDFFIDEDYKIAETTKDVKPEGKSVPAGEFSSKSTQDTDNNTQETEKNKLPDSIDLQDAINLLRLLRRIDIKGL